MTSSCLSGGGRPYGFDLEIVKSPATPSAARASSPASSSLTSTLSGSSNSPLSICTRKARTPRKRPNQTYHEAAALLSTAYPNIFSATTPRLINPPHQAPSPLEDESVFLIHRPSQVLKLPSIHREPGPSPSCPPEENEIQSRAAHLYDEYEEDLEVESILDEEMEEGIMDSIMGEKKSSSCGGAETSDGESKVTGPYWGRGPMALLGLGGRLDIRYGIRKAGVSAWRDVGRVNWWNFPMVDVNEISPKLKTNPAKKKKKDKEKKEVEKPRTTTTTTGADVAARNRNAGKGDLMMGLGVRKSGLMLKLDYDNVLEAWMEGQGGVSPFPDESPRPPP